jgi:hypothetical protein
MAALQAEFGLHVALKWADASASHIQVTNCNPPDTQRDPVWKRQQPAPPKRDGLLVVKRQETCVSEMSSIAKSLPLY